MLIAVSNDRGGGLLQQSKWVTIGVPALAIFVLIYLLAHWVKVKLKMEIYEGGLALAALVVAIFLAVVAEPVIIRGGSEGPSPTPTPSPTVTTKVSAREEWQNSGFQVGRDENVEITADGEWSPWPGYSVGPKGCTDTEFCTPNPNQPNNVYPATHAGLIGKIGDSQPFAVGEKYTIKNSDVAGDLSFRINDIALNDNAGKIMVTIKRLG